MPTAFAYDDLRILSSVVNPRSTSGIAVLGNQERGAELYFKRPRRPGAAQHEALELQRIEHLRGTFSEIDAVKLRSLSQEDNVLLTEFIPCTRSLFNELCNRSKWWRRWHSPATSFREIGMRVGKWLNCYHRTSIVTTEDYSKIVDHLVERGNAKLQALARADSELLSAATMRAVQQYLNDARNASCWWGPQSVSQIHGDFSLANILLAPPTRLVIIDFADSRQGFPLEDIVRCWHAAWALGQVSPSTEHFATSLLDGYQLTQAELGSSLVQLLRCWNAVTYLLTAITLWPRFSRNMRRLVNRLIDVNRHCLESLATDGYVPIGLNR